MGSDLLIHRARAYRQAGIDQAYHATPVGGSGGGSGEGGVSMARVQVALLVSAALAAVAYLMLPRLQKGFDQSPEGKRRLWNASLAAAAVGLGLVLVFYRGE